MQNGTLLAAVDLGSNSFRLEIGRLEHGQVQRIEYLKETVRQGNGLDEARNLTPKPWSAAGTAWPASPNASPASPRARCAPSPRRRCARRATATCSWRAHQILGFPIDVISGREEARLIYQGVAHLLPQSDERRLVVDIGGRSTELILGAVRSPTHGELPRRQRRLVDEVLPEGQFTPAAFERAQIAAQAVLDEALASYPPGSWDVAYGSSGTIGAVATSWPPPATRRREVTRDGLQWLQDQLLQARSADRVRCRR
jgi:exopolyphosphatase/guanosine-5'-triphosphate,3'-diphosphate pyrophosphatase